MKKIKIFALILAIVMLLPLALAGCSKAGDNGGNNGGGNNNGGDGGDPNSQYTAEYHNLGGHQFYFIVRELGKYQHLTVNELYAEAVNGDKINDAVYLRNQEIMEKYNCEIFEDRVENPASAVKEQLLAGEYQYDFIYTGSNALRPLSASNLLVDFRDMEQIDLEKDWWDQNAITGLSIANKVFYVCGDLGTLDERASWVIFFNKDIIEKAHLQSPYELVESGEWTIAKMSEYVEATWADLDGNGEMEIGKDRFGYITETLTNWMHVAACNCHLSRISSSGDIEIPATINDEILTAWNTLKPLLTTEHRDVADSGTRFRQGLGTFFGILSGAILNMSKTETLNFGVLPMPKLNADQAEYWTSFNTSWCYAFAIPVTTENATDAQANGFTNGQEQAAYFLDLLCYKSRDTLNEAFYNQVLKHQMIKDSESVEMLDIALKNKIYDPVVIFDFGKIGTTLFKDAGSNGGQSAGNGSPTKGTDVNYDTLVSLYDSRYQAARKALNNYINYISNED